jgi:hypothetical protein
MMIVEEHAVGAAFFEEHGMPYLTEVIDEGRGILHIGSGILHGEEIISSAQRILKMVKEGFSPQFALTDLSNVSEFNISSDEISRNADLNIMISRYVPSVRVAIIALSSHVYGIARMWQMHSDKTGWVIEIFRDREAANKWLKGTASS